MKLPETAGETAETAAAAAEATATLCAAAATAAAAHLSVPHIWRRLGLEVLHFSAACPSPPECRRLRHFSLSWRLTRPATAPRPRECRQGCRRFRHRSRLRWNLSLRLRRHRCPPAGACASSESADHAPTTPLAVGVEAVLVFPVRTLATFPPCVPSAPDRRCLRVRHRVRPTRCAAHPTAV